MLKIPSPSPSETTSLMYVPLSLKSSLIYLGVAVAEVRTCTWYSMSVERINTSFPKSWYHICWSYSIQPCIAEYKVEIYLSNNCPGMFAVKSMAFLPPVVFQWFKQATIQGLAFVWCVGASKISSRFGPLQTSVTSSWSECYNHPTTATVDDIQHKKCFSWK